MRGKNDDKGNSEGKDESKTKDEGKTEDEGKSKSEDKDQAKGNSEAKSKDEGEGEVSLTRLSSQLLSYIHQFLCVDPICFIRNYFSCAIVSQKVPSI